MGRPGGRLGAFVHMDGPLRTGHVGAICLRRARFGLYSPAMSTTTQTPEMEIGAPGMDVERIVAEIRAEADRKIAAGLYDDARVARAERSNLVQLLGEDDFLTFYLKGLRDAVTVDISDFEIHERRKWGAPLLVRFKKTLWSALKFYTYRLWSQQNQVNSMLAAGLEGIDEQYAAKIRRLEERLAELERRAGGGGAPGG